MTRPVVVLVGPPGSGKSTVGPIVAQKLGKAFRDTDADIVAEQGKDISAIFFDDGEPAFRALETAAVSTALVEHDGVLALGGGAILSAGTRDALGEQTVVFLEVDMAAAARRVGLSRDRPVLALNPRAMLRTLLTDRRRLYEEVATHTVATDALTPDEVADAVVALIT